MLSRSLRHRAPVLWLLLPLMAGLIVGKVSTFTVDAGWLLGGSLLAAALAVTFSRRTIIWASLLPASVFMSGLASYSLHRARLPGWDDLPAREARLTLKVQRVFAPAADGKRVSGLAKVERAEGHLHTLTGQQLYFSYNQRPGAPPPPLRSTIIEVTGVLEALPRNPAFNSFEGYLAAAGMNFKLTRARLNAIVSPPSPYYAFCDRAQHRLGEILSHGLEKHPELAGAQRAMMLGLKTELSEEQNQQFMQSGTMHLFAISGLHIGVIATALYSLLAVLRVPRWPRYIVSLAALWLYVDVTGASPSAVRAFIMVALFETALVLRRPVNPIATLSLAAFVTLLFDPMQLFSASFQMSYAIVAALLLMGLPLADAWTARWSLFRQMPKITWSRPQHILAWLHRALLSSTAVGLATALISTVTGLIFFQLFTPGALIANLVLIPISMLVIVAGFLSLLFGLAGALWLSSLFNYAAALVLIFIQKSIAVFVKLPGVFSRAAFTSTGIGHGVFLLALAAMLYGYSTRWELKRGGFWVPFGLMAAAFVFSVKFG